MLLDAATDLLAEVDHVDALSVRAVTAAAGVSPTAMYLHFADKGALVRAVKLRCFAALRDRLEAAEAAEAGDAGAQLLAMGRSYLAFAREQPGWYAALFDTTFAAAEQADDGGGEDGGGPADPEVGMDVFAVLVRAIARVAGDGEDAAFERATVVWMALHGRVSTERAMPGFPFPGDDVWLGRVAEGWARDTTSGA